MPRKRGSAYLEKRLKRDFPSIFTDLHAGKIKTVRQAAIKAGLIKRATRLDALKRDWKRAAPFERNSFLSWIKTSRIGLKTVTKRPIVDTDRRLQGDVKLVIERWLKTTNSTASDITKEMGISSLDGSLSLALLRSYRINAAMVSKLEHWLQRKGLY